MTKPQSTTHKATRQKPEKQPTPVIPYPQTADTANHYIRQNGLCIAELARNSQIPRYAFVDLLRGRARGYRGDTHRAAIVLGLKPVPEQRAA